MLKILFRRNNNKNKKASVANEVTNSKAAATSTPPVVVATIPTNNTTTIMKQQQQQARERELERAAEQVHTIMSNLATSLEQLNSTALKMTDDPTTQLRFKTNSFFMKCMHGKK